ncbi:TIGR00730 family Rossman fold protein [Candidatus Kaiserbacteria bacterium]|nr:TIGR00730 family Rossman fold protein [Candidatus Kaiserbacteria bacterium]
MVLQADTVAVEKERIANLPVGRTGASRVEEELLSARAKEDEVESWRVFKILAELVAGFDLLRNYDLAATIFGSSRCEADNTVYADAEILARKLVAAGFAVITGGANGVMQAANKGAKDAGGESVGLNITLPATQQANGYTTRSQEFHYFFTRKVMLAFASEVYIFFPGGYGTLDEFFEIMTLVQTKKVKPLPIILIGKDYWQPLLVWFESTLKERYRTIDEGDMRIYDLVETVDEAMAIIKKKVAL